jgi:DNA-damage-inducible protein D
MNESTDIVSLEDIAEENGIRFWHAHKLSEFLGYKDFETFQQVIRKARVSSEQIGIDTDAEFVISEYHGGKTYKLTRFALFLCVVHADEKKPTVAQTKAALAKFADMALQAYSNQIGRLNERDKLTIGENFMESVAHAHGLSKDRFGIFKDAGYRGMYNMPLKKLKEYKGVVKNSVLYDFMGITELAANTFRVTQTAESIRQNNIVSEVQMIETAKNVGFKVRQMVEENTGKSPENLPTEPKIAQIKSGLKRTRKKMLEHDGKKKLN